MRHSYAECGVAAIGGSARILMVLMQCVGLTGVLVTFLVLISNAVTTAAPQLTRWASVGIAFGASLPLVPQIPQV